MAVLDDVKTALRKSGIDLDGEISDLISAARSDLILAGVTADKANSDSDPLIKRALVVYCKANFGWDNPEAERFQKSYDLLKTHLSMSVDYNTEVVI